jgi:hypothetical protein
VVRGEQEQQLKLMRIAHTVLLLGETPGDVPANCHTQWSSSVHDNIRVSTPSAAVLRLLSVRG